MYVRVACGLSGDGDLLPFVIHVSGIRMTSYSSAPLFVPKVGAGMGCHSGWHSE